MKDNEKRTTVQLLGSTKARLDDIGRKNDSYDDIIRRLIDFWAPSILNHSWSLEYFKFSGIFIILKFIS